MIYKAKMTSQEYEAYIWSRDLDGLTIENNHWVITGKCEGQSRDELRRNLRMDGGTVSETPRTNSILVVGYRSGSAKIDKAQQVGCRVITDNILSRLSYGGKNYRFTNAAGQKEVAEGTGFRWSDAVNLVRLSEWTKLPPAIDCSDVAQWLETNQFGFPDEIQVTIPRAPALGVRRRPEIAAAAEPIVVARRRKGLHLA